MPTLLLDFDSTIIAGESLELLLHESLTNDPERESKLQRIREITDLGMSGQLHISESLAQRFAIAAPTPRVIADVSARIVEELITPGFADMLQRLRAQHASLRVMILSAGPLCCIWPVADQLGIARDDCVGLSVVQDEAKNECSLWSEDPVLQGKTACAQRLLDAGRLSSTPVVCVGDGYTDMELRLAGYADAAVGFGVHVQRERTKQVADAFVTSLEECEKAIEAFFAQPPPPLNKNNT